MVVVLRATYNHTQPIYKKSHFSVYIFRHHRCVPILLCRMTSSASAPPWVAGQLGRQDLNLHDILALMSGYNSPAFIQFRHFRMWCPSSKDEHFCVLNSKLKTCRIRFMQDVECSVWRSAISHGINLAVDLQLRAIRKSCRCYSLSNHHRSA